MMKNFKFKAALALTLLVGFASLAFADARDLTFKSIFELPISTDAPAAGDYDVRYVSAAHTVERIDATAGRLAGAFNGTVGATTHSTGAFTTITASSTLGVTGVTTATGGLVSKVTNDFGVPFSTGITANPITYTAYGTCTVAAVNGGTCIPLAANTGRNITVTFFDIVATGSAATCTGIKLEDTNGTPVVIATLAAATLTSGAHNIPLTGTLGVGFGAGSGITAAAGVQILVNGSDCTTTTVFTYMINYTIQ